MHFRNVMEKYREEQSEFIVPHSAVACLYDQTTRVATKETISGKLTLVSIQVM